MRVAFSLRLGVMLTMIVLASARSHTALSAQVAAERPLTGAPTFCQEVLILHHSHLDVGFTHPQSMCWELQQDFFDEALDLLDRTEGWPDESRPRWTAEVTAPVVRWLATADSRRLERFRHHLRSGRLAISGFE